MILNGSGLHRNKSLSKIRYGTGADARQARHVLDKTATAMANGATGLMLDLSETTIVDDNDLYTIGYVAQLVERQQGQQLKLLNPSPSICQQLLQQELTFTDFYADK